LNCQPRALALGVKAPHHPTPYRGKILKAQVNFTAVIFTFFYSLVFLSLAKLGKSCRGFAQILLWI
jgi:hypothetical protein